MSEPQSPIGTLRIESVDDDGQTQDSHTQGIHSWLDNWYTLFGLLGTDTGDKSLTNENGAVDTYENIARSDNPFTSNPDPSIAVGTGTSAFSQSDFNLDTEDSRGRMDSTPVDLANQTVTWSATFTATTQIDISETGILYEQLNTASNNSRSVFVERTVLSSTVNTGSNGDVTVTYDFDFPPP